MRILIVHNKYQQAGGEDAVVKSEHALLKDFGEDVHIYERSNEEISCYNGIEKLSFFRDLGWSNSSYNDMRSLLQKLRPDAVHFHNIFFILSPSVYWACKAEGIPVVQSLHNFRLLCSNALLFREKKVCEECIEKKTLWRGALHGCYKDSRLLTALVICMLRKHWKKKAWVNMVDQYITATEFTRQKYIAVGIPEEKITLKPNTLYPDSVDDSIDGEYALYVGRLSTEKGVPTLLDAWKEVDDIPLKIIGDGPMRKQLKAYSDSKDIKNVDFLGYISQDRYDKYMRGAKFLVFPSICYENFPRIISEAFAYGIPVVASSLGGMSEIIEDRKTGFMFKPGDSHDLASKIRQIAGDGNILSIIRENMHHKHKQDYSPARNYEILTNIYKKVVGNEKHKK